MKREGITRFELSPKKPPKTDWRAFDAMTDEEPSRAFGPGCLARHYG